MSKSHDSAEAASDDINARRASREALSAITLSEFYDRHFEQLKEHFEGQWPKEEAVKFPFNDMTDDHIVEVFQYLSGADVPRLRLVCQRWLAVCTGYSGALPKYRAKSLMLKLAVQGPSDREISHSEWRLFRKWDTRTALWTSSTISSFFADPLARHLAFNGELVIGPDVVVSVDHISQLRTLIDAHPKQFRPMAFTIQEADLAGVDETALVALVTALQPTLTNFTVVCSPLRAAVLPVTVVNSIAQLDSVILSCRAGCLPEDIVRLIQNWLQAAASKRLLNVDTTNRVQGAVVCQQVRRMKELTADMLDIDDETFRKFAVRHPNGEGESFIVCFRTASLFY